MVLRRNQMNMKEQKLVLVKMKELEILLVNWYGVTDMVDLKSKI
jgi:hypothetical protein